MRIKIISDGTSQGTHVVNEQTGERLDLVTRISWELSATHLATATLTLLRVPVEVEGDAAIAERSDAS